MTSKGFIDGYITGVTWKEIYLPGGPHYNSPNEREKDDYPDRYERDVTSKTHHENWHKGFSIGKDHRDLGINYSSNAFIMDLLEENLTLKNKVKYMKQCMMSTNFSIRDLFKQTTKVLEKV